MAFLQATDRALDQRALFQLSLAHAAPQTPQVASRVRRSQRRRMARSLLPATGAAAEHIHFVRLGEELHLDRVGDVLPVAVQEFLFVGLALAFGRAHQIVRAALAEQIQVVLDHVGIVVGGLVAVGEEAQLVALTVLVQDVAKGVLLGIKLGGVEFARMEHLALDHAGATNAQAFADRIVGVGLGGFGAGAPFEKHAGSLPWAGGASGKGVGRPTGIFRKARPVTESLAREKI